jgi:hypothetical protein
MLEPPAQAVAECAVVTSDEVVAIAAFSEK